jgi:hypothetical protein
MGFLSLCGHVWLVGKFGKGGIVVLNLGFGVLLVENVVFGKSWDRVFLEFVCGMVCLVGWKMVEDWNLGFM